MEENVSPDNDPSASPFIVHSSLSHNFAPSPQIPLPDKLNLSDSDDLSSSSDESPSSVSEARVGQLTRPTLMSKLLSHQVPHLKPPAFNPKTTAQVLTSAESHSIIEQKAREKKEKQELKEKRKQERLAKQKEIAELKEKQKQEREAKKKEKEELKEGRKRRLKQKVIEA